MTPLADQLRNAIRQSPINVYEIAAQSGVSHTQIYRFLKGTRSLTLETADKILRVIAKAAINEEIDSPLRSYLRELGQNTEKAG